MIKKLLVSVFFLGLMACLGIGGFLYWTVVLEPGPEISPENIRSILGKESPVYYSDGVSPLGVFFADAHRQYVEYEEIPKDFINALVAAEDNRFFSHFGFDLVGITRAAIKNVQAGRIVQGGSTLTQQTAKNLFKRKNRSVKAKLKELLYALRLEYHYTKEQILEFYANQFYVSGNGLGLGVAARYYFDKDPGELSLVEAAYIAGSVKRPNYYNPFLKHGEDALRQALERGRARVAYVLANMRELGTIGETEYRQALAAEIPFNKGEFGYSLDYVMGMVTDAVASEQVVEALAEHGIDNIATSGIRIITSVDRRVQAEALHALRKQLSYLDVRLRGYQRDQVQQELTQTEYAGDLDPEPGNFLFGTISSISRAEKQPEIEVDLGRDNGSGVIDLEGLRAMVDGWVKWRDHRWTEVADQDYLAFLESLAEGDRVWVSVRSRDETGRLHLDLERFPLVKGGAIVLKHGQIVAVAGGVENRFFNRAVYGRRTMGSSYKPFVYAAALQLGWNAADLLPNERDVFVYQNQAYFPRPDHDIEYDRVSMSWAGVRSENLASVWLAAHLCDHLSRSQLLEVASRVGLAPRIVDGEQEPYRLFRSRIRDRYGIVVDQDMVRQAAFRKTVATIGPDLIFEGLQGEHEAIQRLHYGLGFRTFIDEVEGELEQGGLSESERNELLLRRRILAGNFLDLTGLRRDLRRFVERTGAGRTGFESRIGLVEPESPGLFYDRLSERYLFGLPKNLPAGVSYVDRANLLEYLDAVDPAQRRAFIDGIYLGGRLSVAAFDFLDSHVDREFQAMRTVLPYSLEVLEYVDDYRTMVGLHYLVAFGTFLGIESELEPVLSFPLGANVVTLLETTRVYEALATGEVTLFREENGEINNTLAILDRIESEDGELLYRPDPEVRRAVDPQTSLMIGHILENTIKFGTGRYADQEVKLAAGQDRQDQLTDLSLPVPMLGKTGTANRYTNASFYGFLPGLNSQGNGMQIGGGYAVGVYVGYDDNDPMRRGSTRITGASGALPAWTEIVNSLLREEDYAGEVDPVDLTFYGLILRRESLGQLNLGVSSEAGGKLGVPAELVEEFDRYRPSIMTFGALEPDGAFRAEREFRPFWKQQQELVPADTGGGIIEQDL